MRRHRWLLALLPVLLFVSACHGPTPVAGPAPNLWQGTINPLNDPNQFAWNYPSYGYAAVDFAFQQWEAQYPGTLYCAHKIAERESHHHAGSVGGNPAKYFGMFQLDKNKAGTVFVSAQTLGVAPSWYQPWVNAWAAMLTWYNGGRSWAPWGGC